MIFKLAVIGFVGLLALPSLAPGDVRLDTQPVSSISSNGQPYEDGFSAVAMFTGIAQDLTGLCMRQPTICIEGARLADATMVRAEHGFRVAHAMVMKHHQRNMAESELPSIER